VAEGSCSVRILTTTTKACQTRVTIGSTALKLRARPGTNPWVEATNMIQIAGQGINRRPGVRLPERKPFANKSCIKRAEFGGVCLTAMSPVRLMHS
jgi:hypothetical protein